MIARHLHSRLRSWVLSKGKYTVALFSMSTNNIQMDEEEKAFLFDEERSDELRSHQPAEKRSYSWRTFCTLRSLIEVSMAVVIVVLLAMWPTSQETIRRTPVPKCERSISVSISNSIWLHAVPTKIYTFNNQPKYDQENMFFNESATLKTLHNWIELSSGNWN